MKLEANAQQLLSFVQQQTKRIDRKTEQAIEAACEKATAPLSAEKLEQVLVSAMPEHAQKIKQIAKKPMSFHCDSTKGDFITQIVGTHKIEKEVAAVYTAPQITRTYRDPLTAEIIMAKNADLMLLFNAGVFDDAGRPLLMKIVAREKMKDKIPDISNYHTLTKEPDVQYVANDAAYVTIKDTNEAEFAFGHPLAQVSLDAKGNELSRSGAVHPKNEQKLLYYYGMTSPSGAMVPNMNNPVGWAPQVTTGASLDTTPVQRYEDRIQLQMSAKDTFPKGGWLDTPIEHVDASLLVEPGYMLEPDSKGTITFNGASVETAVKADDFSFIGSPSGESKVPVENYKHLKLGELLQQHVYQTTQSGGGANDQQSTSTPAYKLIYSDKKKTKIGGQALSPLSDRTLNKEDFEAAGVKAWLEPLKGDPAKDGQEVFLDLGKSFLAGEEGASVKGWKIVVGFEAGPNGQTQWCEAKPRTVSSPDGSSKESFKLQLESAPEAIQLNRKLEIRVFNDRGVPAQRVLIPFNQIPWGNSNDSCEPSH
jgi:hypothetical protein